MSRAKNIYNVGHSVKEVKVGELNEAQIKILKSLGFDDETISKVHSVVASAIQLGPRTSGRQTESGFKALYKRSLAATLQGAMLPENIITDYDHKMKASCNLNENRNSFRFDFTNPLVLEVQENGMVDYIVTVVPFIYDDSPLINGMGCVNIQARENVLELVVTWKPETTESETTDVETGNTPA